MRRFLPDSIAGWTVLVLVLGLALSQLGGLLLYAVNRHDVLATIGGQVVADRVAAIVPLVEDASEGERQRVLRTIDVPGLRVGWSRAPLVAAQEAEDLAATIRMAIVEQLGDRDVRVAVYQPGELWPPPSFENRAHRRIHGPPRGPLVRLSVHLADGSWLNFASALDVAAGSFWRPRFAFPLILTLLVVGALSAWAVRRATRPFAVFATAAERLGVDVTAPPLAERGPREVRRAAHAFNEMQTRLRRFIEDRTQMLAAISHDLRTPITRMRLRAEFIEDGAERDKMLADLAEMEAMIAATLSFARDDATREERRPVDLAALLRGLCDDMGGSFVGSDALVVQGRPTTLKRAFANLIDNAVKYGGAARLRLSRSEREALVEIDDDGPGIPEAEQDKVFLPFYRLERSRSRETGGTGLGLAVVRNVVRAHGGDVTLGNRPGGGLTVMVTLPI